MRNPNPSIFRGQSKITSTSYCFNFIRFLALEAKNGDFSTRICGARTIARKNRRQLIDK
jgi:hypothetical protein